MARRKTNPDHRFRLGYAGTCSCGWVGATWMGEGARSNAAGEWHGHRERCEKEREN